jgi:hypothetical protein
VCAPPGSRKSWGWRLKTLPHQYLRAHLKSRGARRTHLLLRADLQSSLRRTAGARSAGSRIQSSSTPRWRRSRSAPPPSQVGAPRPRPYVQRRMRIHPFGAMLKCSRLCLWLSRPTLQVLAVCPSDRGCGEFCVCMCMCMCMCVCTCKRERCTQRVCWCIRLCVRVRVHLRVHVRLRVRAPLEYECVTRAGQ